MKTCFLLIVHLVTMANIHGMEYEQKLQNGEKAIFYQHWRDPARGVEIICNKTIDGYPTVSVNSYVVDGEVLPVFDESFPKTEKHPDRTETWVSSRYSIKKITMDGAEFFTRSFNGKTIPGKAGEVFLVVVDNTRKSDCVFKYSWPVQLTLIADFE